jgi:hypothetical protein
MMKRSILIGVGVAVGFIATVVITAAVTFKIAQARYAPAELSKQALEQIIEDADRAARAAATAAASARKAADAARGTATSAEESAGAAADSARESQGIANSANDRAAKAKR